jgi:glyoxylase-like metal-dependent hydrolase (beta-lactamase superfamily II)
MTKSSYTLIPIDGETTAIEEKRLGFQCLCYLLRGKERALLIDSGFGLGDLAGEIAPLLGDKPLWLVNTHAHFDHLGCNHQFEGFFLSRDEEEVFRLHTDSAYLWRNAVVMIPGPLRLIFRSTLNRLFSPKALGTKTLIDDGHVFDLGDRLIEVIASPGHSPGSLCLLDRGRRLLFSGDSLCDLGVMLNLDYSLSPEVYLGSLEKLKSLSGAYDRIYPGHHGFPVPPERLEEYLACVRGILAGTLPLKRAGRGPGAFTKATYGKIRLTLPPDYPPGGEG